MCHCDTFDTQRTRTTRLRTQYTASATAIDVAVQSAAHWLAVGTALRVVHCQAGHDSAAVSGWRDPWWASQAASAASQAALSTTAVAMTAAATATWAWVAER